MPAPADGRGGMIAGGAAVGCGPRAESVEGRRHSKDGAGNLFVHQNFLAQFRHVAPWLANS